MKKMKKLLTFFIVAGMTICMSSMIFGYDYNEEYMKGRILYPSTEYLTSMFSSGSTKCVMQPYYTSISAAGSYSIGVYADSNGSGLVLYDSESQSVKAKSTSGFYTHSLNTHSGKDHVGCITCYDTIITLDYMKIRHD